MSKRHQEEDYGDYVTRCVCGFTHDDGYMICCDGCSVWQHVECMKVDPKNLPDKYLCEMCEPRSVDRKRARQIQIRKREEMSDFDDDDSGSMSTDDSRRSMTHSPNPHAVIKRNKRPRLHQSNQHQQSQQRPSTRVQELKAEARRSKREKEEGKKMKKKSMKYTEPHSPSVSSRMMTGVQTLLTAASALEEQQQSNELWSSSSSPWSDPYETIEHNQYSDELRSFLASQLPQLRQEVIVYTPEEYAALGPFSPCMVRDVAVTRKGVVSEAHIAEDDMVMEYKGKVTLKQVLLSEAGVKSLWKSKPCPFVYHYDRIPTAGICIDARKHGNLARFIRRSCAANSELRYFLVGNELHFGVYASSHISPREEITLPFDFPVEKCDYSIECACNQKNCPVAEGTGGCRSRRTSKGNDEEQVQRKSSKGRATPAHPPPNEDSNSSWTSAGSGHKRKKHRHALPPVAAPSTTVAVQTQSSKEVSESDSDDQDNEGNKKQKSREERKTEAVWKMFEKMEASERRRQQHLLSEGSHDGDTSPLPQPLTPRTFKERRISSTSSSRKAQLLPSAKPRLSSVSSMDLLSPEPLDAFSPPLTPSLSVSYPHDLDPPCSLSTASLASSLPKLSFEVTPYLHPKYLLADFALPRKKAILRQWEMELRGTGTTYPLTTGGSRHWMANSFAMACAHAMEGKRSPRVRGSLKHRWIKRHEDDCKRLNSSGSSSESSSPHHQDEHNILQDALPYKKWFLRRWEESTCSNSIMSNPPHGCLTLLEKSSIMRPMEMNSLNELAKDEEEHPLSKQPTGPETTPTSFTLFDDFSDDDFEEVSEKNGRRHVEDRGNYKGIASHAERNRLAGELNAFQRNDPDRRHKESVPGSGANTEGSDADRKLLPATENHQPVDGSPITPSPSPPPPAPAPTNTSLPEPEVPTPHFELGQDLLHMEAAKSGAENTLQPATTTTVSTITTTATASCSVDVLAPDHVQPEGDASAGRPPVAEPRVDCTSLQSSPVVGSSAHQDGSKPGLAEMVEMELSSPSQFNQIGADPYPSGESPDDAQPCDNLVEGSRSVVDEGSLSEKPCGLLESLNKPAGKRKMSLLEYRSRARKPAEQRKAPSPSPDRRNSSAPSPLANVSAGTITPPIQSPGVSYLSFSSSFLSGSSSRALSGPASLNTSVVSPATAAPPPATDGDHSHFEPVSPDEGDHTPQHADDGAAVHPSLTSLQPPGLPPSSVPPPPTMPEQLLPAASSAPMFPVSAPTPPQPQQQQQQQYPLMENRWGQPGMEIAQDPRRAAHALPEMYRPQQQPLPPQVTASPEVIHGCYPGPYPPPPPMMHPPQPAPMMMGQKFGGQRPGFMPPRLQMPHPMYRPPPPPPPHHSNSSPFF